MILPAISPQRSLDQERGRVAWVCVSQAKGQPYAKEYGALARSAPADIQSNGLGQTLAFWNAKGKGGDNEHTRLLADVSQWVAGRLTQHQAALPPGQNLLDWIVTTAETDQYRVATAESIAFLLWLKRFAEAELD